MISGAPNIHTIQGEHSWIMLLPSRQRKTSKFGRNVASGLMKLSSSRKKSGQHQQSQKGQEHAFQDFTGYKMFHSPTKDSKTRNHDRKEWAFWSNRDPEIVLMPSTHTDTTATERVPSEISVSNSSFQSEAVPAVIHIPLVRSDSRLVGEDILSLESDNRSDVSSESSLEYEPCLAFPTGNMQEWGISVAVLDETSLNAKKRMGLDQREDDVNTNDNWPSDEEQTSKHESMDSVAFPPFSNRKDASQVCDLPLPPSNLFIGGKSHRRSNSCQPRISCASE